MASKGTSGWESLGGNDPTKYQASFPRNNGTIAPSGQQGKSDVVVITNRSNGNYDVYKKTFFGNKLIYQYNASTNKPTIVNQADFNDFFTGENTQQYTNLNSGVKQATLNLAEENLSGSTSRKEYQELQQTPGYKSLSNTEEPPLPPSDPDIFAETGRGADAPLSTGLEQPVDVDNDNSGDDSAAAATDFALLGSEGLLKDDTKFNTDDKFFTRKFEEDGERLTYPEADLTSFGFDYIQITGYKYTTLKAGGFGAFGKNSKSGYEVNTFEDNKGVSSKLGQITKIIQLPMQPSISESNAVDWTQDEINEIQRRAAGLAASGITGIQNAKSLGDGVKVAANLIGSGSEIVKNMLTNEKLGPFLTAHFAGQAVGANIVGRSTGQVLNKNLELLFKGPKLRQFSFNFTFTPRSDTEALTIKKMIRFFKKSMAPEISPERIFLYTPDIFQLQYIHNKGGGHPYLNRFKPCALTNFSANYTPGNSYMTYKDGSMTQYQVAMTFSELEPIYQNDHDVAGGTGF